MKNDPIKGKLRQAFDGAANEFRGDPAHEAQPWCDGRHDYRVRCACCPRSGSGDGVHDDDCPYYNASAHARQGCTIPDCILTAPHSAACVPEELIDHPHYYGGGDNPYEAIKVIENWELSFCLGTAVKYIARNGKKHGEPSVKDLKKAVWYINREIENAEKARGVAQRKDAL